MSLTDRSPTPRRRARVRPRTAPTTRATGATPRRASDRAALTVATVAVIALLVHLSASFGLFAIAPEWTAPVVIGLVAALASGANWQRTLVGTAMGVALGVVLAAPWFLHPAAQGSEFVGRAALYVALACGAAAGAAWGLSRAPSRRRAEWMLGIALVAAIVAGMWVTTAAVNSGAFANGGETLNQMLSTRPDLGKTPEDRDIYLRLFYDVHDGRPYYTSVAAIWLADSTIGNHLPIGVTSYRLPTIFYLWRVLPRNGAAIPWAFLVFATLAVASGFSIGAQLSRPGVAVVGALMVAAAYSLIATTPWVTFVDGWAMALTLAGIALFIASVRKDSRGLLWAAVAVLFASATLRELLVYPMLLAAASALLLPRKERWRAARPWLAGIAAFAAVYAAHIAAVAGRVDTQTGYGYWTQGGPAHLAATLEFFAPYFGARPLLLPLLVVLGIAGALSVWASQRRLSAFLTATVAGPLAAFLVFGNGGTEVATGTPSGYWGILVVPIALALVPVALEWAMVSLGVPAKSEPVG